MTVTDPSKIVRSNLRSKMTTPPSISFFLVLIAATSAVIYVLLGYKTEGNAGARVDFSSEIFWSVGS
ncbi:MAG: hypothetical protein ACXAEU_19610 [Candidatus Hodarchaeales archaeon]|jgi:hypothetical protein